MKDKTIAFVSAETIEDCIYFVRGHKIMLDIDLAVLYEIPPKRLKEQVKRNQARFPEDFMFILRIDETQAALASRSHNATLKRGSNIKYGSYAFTEQGVAMLSSVLHSPRAIEVNIAIMRAFVRMRGLLLGNRELAKRLQELENKLIAHDYQIEDIVKAIRGLMAPRKSKPKIGYLA